MNAQRHRWNRRKAMAVLLAVSVILLAAIAIAGQVLKERALATDFTRKNLPPSLAYPFGTDWMGRDMLKRTVAGLSLSIRLGLLTAAISAAVALALALLASLGGGRMDSLVCGLINLVMGIPHMLLLILISYSLGKGFRGVAAGIALTHWASLARLLRAEILQIRESPYVQISEKLGKKPWWIAWNHIVPQVSRQFVTGLILLFPHAILHEAGVTFLGFGLSSEQPAIGVILSESMSYLITGKWWLALFPGAALVLVTLGFQAIGQSLGRLMDPGSAHE